ncbi:MAG: MarR family transcriptional regulator [Fusobacterium sp. JB019]|nr:MarR family transcriptional regulator [Fusobacterium sp. JB019]
MSQLSKERKEKVITDLFMKVHGKAVAASKIPREFGTGEELFSSEIHTIYYIGVNKGVNLTELSNFMEISKAAASKFVNKMHKKGYIIKENNPVNKKEIVLVLSEKGKKAFDSHEVYHSDIYDKIKELLDKYGEKEIETIIKFLLDVDEYFLRERAANKKEV